MIEDLTGQAISKLFDVGVIGVLCVLLILVLIYRERYWQNRETTSQEKSESAIKDERAAADKARDALLVEARSNAETVAFFRAQMTQWTNTMETVLKIARKEI